MYAGLLAVAGIAAAPIAVPVLPPQALVQYMNVFGSNPVQMERLDEPAMPQYFADRFGWPEMVAKVAGVYNQLPPVERARACIFTGNYGEAGAIDFFGPAYGLPKAVGRLNVVAAASHGARQPGRTAADASSRR